MKKSYNTIKGPIGVDFDNTIVSYDDVFFKTAIEFKLIKPSNDCGKKAIRNTVRQIENGDIEWQKLQAEVYGPRMVSADLMDGVAHFFLQCNLKSIPIYIVSHKTAFANYDTTRTNLRETAIKWMDANNFFNPKGVGLDRSNIYFESTRQNKIRRIKDLGCKYFIDDLEEIFSEKTFPTGINKILFDRHNASEHQKNVRICNTWREITEGIFGPIK